MKLKIKKNVGLALVKQKRFGKGIEVYEDIMNDTPDFDVGFNLLHIFNFAHSHFIKMEELSHSNHKIRQCDPLPFHQSHRSSYQQ